MDLYFDVVKLQFLIVGFVANLLTIIAHLVDPLRLFRNTSSMFVLNITVIHCMTSLLWLILYALSLAEYIAFFTSGYFLIYVNFTVRMATMTAIAYFSLALELYYSISRPLWHRSKVTHKVCRYWIIATWVFHLTFHEVMGFFLSDAYEGLFIVCYCGPFFFIIQFLHIATFISLRRQGQALRERRDVNEATLRALKIRQDNEKHFLKTIAILSVVLTLSVCPYFVFKSLFTFPNLLPETDGEVWIWLDFITYCLIIINAIVNPFFYLWRLSKYKKTFKKLYCKCFK